MRKKLPKVTYRQEGGDDGYSYVVRIDGREYMNGLNRRMAQYYKQKILDEARAKADNV